jgi:SAM-dependent methyltransferase
VIPAQVQSGGPGAVGETRTPTSPPQADPAPWFEIFRGSFGTELFVAAVAHFGLFDRLATGPRSFGSLSEELGLAPRALNVLLTAVRAMGAVARDPDGSFRLTESAREHLLRTSPHFMGDYCALAAGSPGVLEMVERLRTNRPKGSDEGGSGVGFIYRDGLKSAMDSESMARHFTLSLAGRARNVAPALAERLPMAGAQRLLDVGGGTGIYSVALLRRNPGLRAVVFDRPEVLRVAAEFAAGSGVADRLELRPGDFFTDPFPAGADAILLSNILHDWDVPECQVLLRRCAEALPSGGRLILQDVFLDDDLGGPLPIALYSAALFSVTEGRAYSAAEYSGWLREVGLHPIERIPTLAHCAALVAVKR